MADCLYCSRADFSREATLLRDCAGCDFITRIVAFYPACEGSPQHLVMEARAAWCLLPPIARSRPKFKQLMAGGDIMDGVLLKRRPLRGPHAPWMSDAEVRIAIWRVLRALQFMHGLSAGGTSILHRDIKPDNILTARLGPDGCGDCSTAKLADLGHAKELDGVSRTWTTGIGTGAYMPPEVAAAQLDRRNNVGHTKALDMWSVGVVLYVCFLHDYPYGTAAPDDAMAMTQLNINILTHGLDGMAPSALAALVPPGSAKAALFAQRSVHGRHLMQALLQRDPRQRLSVQAALSHAWFDGIDADAGACATP